MRVALDFADPARALRVPQHGWAYNSQGLRLLWLPIVRLVHQAPESRKAGGLSGGFTPGGWSEIRAFGQICKNFALCLRELAMCARLGADLCLDRPDDEKYSESHHYHSLVPLYVDLAFVYARRLADHFARASRYALFKNVPNAPREYKKLRAVVDDSAALERLGPLCERTALQEAFNRHSGWFDALRDSTNEHGELQKGIRDIMEHHPIAVTVQSSKVGDGPWEVKARLGERPINSSYRPDLLATLREIVDGTASLWTGVCGAARLPVVSQQWIVPYGDALVLLGNDEDSTAFWPESTG